MHLPSRIVEQEAAAVLIDAKVVWSHITLCDAERSTGLDAVRDVTGYLQWQVARSPASPPVKQTNGRQATSCSNDNLANPH